MKYIVLAIVLILSLVGCDNSLEYVKVWTLETKSMEVPATYFPISYRKYDRLLERMIKNGPGGGILMGPSVAVETEINGSKGIITIVPDSSLNEVVSIGNGLLETVLDPKEVGGFGNVILWNKNSFGNSTINPEKIFVKNSLDTIGSILEKKLFDGKMGVVYYDSQIPGYENYFIIESIFLPVESLQGKKRVCDFSCGNEYLIAFHSGGKIKIAYLSEKEFSDLIDIIIKKELNLFFDSQKKKFSIKRKNK